MDKHDNVKKARCMLSNAKLMRNFCIEAVRTTVYLVNRSHAIAINCKTPNEVWSRKLAHNSNLKIFGCPACYHGSKGK